MRPAAIFVARDAFAGWRWHSIFYRFAKEDFAVLRFGWFAFAVALVAASAVFAADNMAPSEIQATFFTGQAFTARTPSGAKFKMTFTPDGKMTREPLAPLAQGGNASTGSGTWKLSAMLPCRGQDGALQRRQ
jgi:hypothetical protein